MFQYKAKVEELEAQIAEQEELFDGKMKETSAELELLRGRRERESEEEGNLFEMLRGDVDRLTAER